MSHAASKVVFHAPQDIRVEPPGPAPEPAPGEVLVRVLAAAICGSDVKTYHHGNPRIKPPQTMGHEFCGIIECIGASVDNYREGQRVTMATTMGCGDCKECRAGHGNICSDLQAMGFHHEGAMAPWAIIPKRGVHGGNLIDVGDLAPEIAALSEPTSCVVNSLSRLEGRGGKTMLVIGLGPLGLLHGMMAREQGFDTVVGAARPGPRFEAARSFGFDAVVDAKDLSAAVNAHTGGHGFDAVMVTAPSADMQSLAPEWAAPGGAVSLFASLPKGGESITLNSRTVHYKEQIVYGVSDSTPAHVGRAVAWLTRHAREAEKLITHRYSLSDFPSALQDVIERRALKAVLFP